MSEGQIDQHEAGAALTPEKTQKLIELITSEFNVVHEFAKDKDERKSQLFRYSITLFTTFSTVVLAVFGFFTKSSELNIQSLDWFSPLFSLILVGIGIINFVLIKHYSEAHIGRILAAQQANLLRRSQATIVFYLIEDRLPDSDDDLISTDTGYWKYFGRSQCGDIDNKGLIARESSAFLTSAGSTMLTMLAMSITALLLPVVYHIFAYSSVAIFIASVFVSLFVFSGGLSQIYLSHSRLLKRLREHEASTGTEIVTS
ncbi:MAG: hypothetical protein AAGG48_18165 [Planctomycetota bacterium]